MPKTGLKKTAFSNILTSAFFDSQKGFAPILLFLVLLLIGGVALGVYLVGNKTFFTPSASVSAPVSPEISISLLDTSTKCTVGDTSTECSPIKHLTGDQFTVQVLVHSDFDAANQFAAKLKFPADKFEVLGLTTAAPEVSVPENIYPIKSWLEEFYDNSTGEISLVGGVPDPGIKTEPSFKYIMASVQFRVKPFPSNEVIQNPSLIEVTEFSAIYRNSDNVNVLTDPTKRRSLKIDLSVQPSLKPVPSGVPCDLNADGKSDKTDSNLYTAKFGTSVASNQAFDLNADGKVDLLDMNIWLSRCPAVSPSPTSSASPGHTLSGNDGTWCDDSDGNGNIKSSGDCSDSTGFRSGDFCDGAIARDGYCTGSWNGSAWSKVHCEFGGYVCGDGSDPKTCFAGTCISPPSPTPTVKPSVAPSASPKTGCVGFESGDANKDKFINLTDSSNLMTKFNKQINDCADMNGDGKINVLDLSMMRKLLIDKGIIKIRPSTASPSAVLKSPTVS